MCTDIVFDIVKPDFKNIDTMYYLELEGLWYVYNVL